MKRELFQNESLFYDEDMDLYLLGECDNKHELNEAKAKKALVDMGKEIQRKKLMEKSKEDLVKMIMEKQK